MSNQEHTLEASGKTDQEAVAGFDSTMGKETVFDEIPAGYKRTEAGVIPEDWESRQLSDFGTFRSGNGFPIVFQGGQVGDYPFFKVSDMNNDGNKLFMRNASHWISEEIRQRIRGTKFLPGSIVFAKIGAAIFLERKRLLHRTSCLDNNMMAFSITDVRANYRFFYYWLCRVQLGKLVSTTALPSLSGREIGKIYIPVPSPKDQRAISTALSDADALIDSLDRLITKKRAIKQAAMQQLLTGQTRLPGFEGEWETKRLGDMGSFYKGQGIKRDEISDEGMPCIRYGEIYTRYENCVISPFSKIPSKTAASSFPLKKGDLLFAGSGETAEEIGKCIVYLGDSGACAGGDIVILRPVFGDPAYLGYLMNHPVVNEQKVRMSQGDAVVHIGARSLAQIEVKLPPPEEQRAIATVLSDMDAEIEALKRRREKARQIKQGMMQQLLTGRVRLVKPGAVGAA